MVKVKMVDSVFVEATGATYEKGQVYEVSDAIAKRHVDSGLMKEVETIKKDKK